MSLGSFGTPHDALDVDFDFFGTMVRVSPDLSDLSLLDVIGTISTFDDKTPPHEITAAIDGLRRATIHEGDLDVFRAVSKKNRQGLEDLVALAQSLLAAVTEVPTVRQSSSSSGPTSTGSSSAAASSSPVVQRLEASGRPELALMVVRAQEFAHTG
jgi:hypothetical protein